MPRDLEPVRVLGDEQQRGDVQDERVQRPAPPLRQPQVHPRPQRVLIALAPVPPRAPRPRLVRGLVVRPRRRGRVAQQPRALALVVLPRMHHPRELRLRHQRERDRHREERPDVQAELEDRPPGPALPVHLVVRVGLEPHLDAHVEDERRDDGGEEITRQRGVRERLLRRAPRLREETAVLLHQEPAQEVRHVHGGSVQGEEAADGGVSHEHAQDDVKQQRPAHLQREGAPDALGHERDEVPQLREGVPERPLIPAVPLPLLRVDQAPAVHELALRSAVGSLAEGSGVRDAVEDVQDDVRRDDAADEGAAALRVEVAADVPGDEDEGGDVEAVDGVHEHLRGLVPDLVEGLAEVARAHEQDEEKLGHVQALAAHGRGAREGAKRRDPGGVAAGVGARRGRALTARRAVPGVAPARAHGDSRRTTTAPIARPRASS